MKLYVQIDIHNDHGIGKLHVCKQCSSCKTTINSLRQYIMIGT